MERDSRKRAEALLAQMTATEKVGQLNQHLYGFRIYHVEDGKIIYDIRFPLYYNNRTIKILVNVEAQKSISYTKLGYHYSHKIENFFIDYYPQEIYENNMQATDLLYFSKTRAN